MPEIVNCPQCDRKLRVPDELLGQAVKCPTCGTTFTAAMAAPSPGPAPAPAPRPSEPDLLQQRYEQSGPRESPSYPGPLGRGGGSESPYGDYGAYESAVNQRRMALRGSALAAVSGPATALMVSAIIGIIFQALAIVAQIGKEMGPNKGADDPEVIGAMVGGCVGMVFVIALTVICIIGCQKMKRLESYGWAMAASIIMMIPCISPCCVLGLPFGIWSLTVLNSPEVKDAFQS